MIADAGEAPQVVIEATYGWYWVVDLLQELGATVHLANPKALNWGERRVKNDVIDATDLADMLQVGSVAGGVDRAAGDPGVARVGALPREVGATPQWSQSAGACGDGQRRSVARHGGHVRPGGEPSTRSARARPQLRDAGGVARELIAVYDGQIVILERDIAAHLRHHRGYRAVQAINGVGPTIAAVIVAEIGDVTRFPTPEHLCSWAGLTPEASRVRRQSASQRDLQTRIPAVALGAIEAISRYHGGPVLAGKYGEIAKRRGKNRARVAVARKVLTLAYYGLRDGEIRCLASAKAA